MFLSNKIIYGYVIALGITSLGTASGLMLSSYYYREALQKSQTVSQERKFLNTLQLNILYNRPTKYLSFYTKDPNGLRQEIAKLLEYIQKNITLLGNRHSLGNLSTIEELEPLLTEYEFFLREFKQETQALMEQLDRLDLSPKTLTEIEFQLVNFLQSKNFIEFIELPDRLSPFVQIVDKREEEVDAALNQAQVLRSQINITSLILLVAISALFIKYASRAISIDQVNINQKLQSQQEALLKVEAKLQKSEDHHRALISAIPDTIIRINRLGFYLEFVARPNFPMSGVLSDLVGTHISEILPLDVVEQRMTYIQIALQTNSIQIYEQDISTDDKTQIEEVRIVPYSEDEVLLLVRDISDRKRAEENLEKESRRSAMLFNTSLDGLFILDLQGNVIEANQSFANMLGYSLEEVTKMSIFDIDAKATSEEIKERVQGFSQYKRVKFETFHRRKDGSICTVEISASSVDWAGEIVQFGICRDITARKQAEQELQQLNQALEAKVKERTSELQRREIELRKLSERLTLSLKSGAIGTWEWDIKQNIILWDERMYELYGVAKQPDHPTANDLSQTVVYDIWFNGIHPDDRIAIEALLQQAVLGQAEYDTEFRVVHPDQSIHFIKAYGMVMRDAQGNPQSVIGVNFDISDRKQAELQLKQTNEELIRATRLKDEFLANMSHELRTPLNAILGMTEGLQEKVYGDINAQQLKALNTIESSGSHLLDLINDILDLAKIEAGQIELHYTPTSISQLCQSSLLFIKQQALQKCIQFEIKLQANLPDLLIDERRIRQVLINLLNNAVKFTPLGGKVTLEVTQISSSLATSDPSLPQYLRIAVSDTGIGISPENIKRLFQPFMQIDSALNRQYEGTGLGLALVKRIVELHGGRVELTSELGMGSCFTVEIPYNLNDLAEVIDSKNGLDTAPFFESSSISEAIIQSPLILLVEDNEANTITISSYLEAKGYRVLLAKNGQEAIALAKAHQPDIILMDIQMPVMDGLEATKQIRLDPNLVDIPIIALTALAMTGDRDRCLEAGANEYLSKPVKLKQLATIIQSLL